MFAGESRTKRMPNMPLERRRRRKEDSTPPEQKQGHFSNDTPPDGPVRGMASVGRTCNTEANERLNRPGRTWVPWCHARSPSSVRNVMPAGPEARQCKQGVVFVTASPEARGELKRLWPLASGLPRCIATRGAETAGGKTKTDWSPIGVSLWFSIAKCRQVYCGRPLTNGGKSVRSSEHQRQSSLSRVAMWSSGKVVQCKDGIASRPRAIRARESEGPHLGGYAGVWQKPCT